MAGMDILASAFNGANAAFLADLYARWAGDPSSVDPSFADLFAAMNDEARAVLEDASGASWAPRPRFAGDEAPVAKPVEGGLAPDQVRAATVASRADADPVLPGARTS
jgi:2-oxoglutarate dehydrogenase E1 component